MTTRHRREERQDRDHFGRPGRITPVYQTLRWLEDRSWWARFLSHAVVGMLIGGTLIYIIDQYSTKCTCP